MNKKELEKKNAGHGMFIHHLAGNRNWDCGCAVGVVLMFNDKIK